MMILFDIYRSSPKCNTLIALLVFPVLGNASKINLVLIDSSQCCSHLVRGHVANFVLVANKREQSWLSFSPPNSVLYGKLIKIIGPDVWRFHYYWNSVPSKKVVTWLKLFYNRCKDHFPHEIRRILFCTGIRTMQKILIPHTTFKNNVFVQWHFQIKYATKHHHMHAFPYFFPSTMIRSLITLLKFISLNSLLPLGLHLWWNLKATTNDIGIASLISVIFFTEK